MTIEIKYNNTADRGQRESIQRAVAMAEKVAALHEEMPTTHPARKNIDDEVGRVLSVVVISQKRVCNDTTPPIPPVH